jgi:hypothetical protein
MNKMTTILKIVVCFIKSLLSGFTQILWTMVAIFVFRNYAEDLLMSYPGAFTKMMSVIFNGWIGILVALTVFYMFVDLREVGLLKKVEKKCTNCETKQEETTLKE